MGLPADVRAERLSPQQFVELAGTLYAMRLRALAPAKVNLSLFLGGTREDGRHRLVTRVRVAVAGRRARARGDGGRGPGRLPGGRGGEPRCAALAGLRARGWDGPPVRVAIEKRIPVAAGMAGGSADAAATLRLAMAVAPGRAEEVDQLAVELGADVPEPAAARGRAGDRAPARSSSTSSRWPSTRSWSCPRSSRSRRRMCSARPTGWGCSARRRSSTRCTRSSWAALAPGAGLPERLLVNDLEPAAVSLCPWCGDALEAVRAAGAEHAIVSGSGPTVVGIWWGPGAWDGRSRRPQELRDRYPLAVGRASR